MADELTKKDDMSNELKKDQKVDESKGTSKSGVVWLMGDPGEALIISKKSKH